MTLGGNQLLKENSRLRFNADESMYNFLKHNLQKEHTEGSSDEEDKHWKIGKSIFEESQKRDTLKSKGGVQDEIKGSQLENDFNITLAPMQIRTFVVEVKRN